MAAFAKAGNDEESHEWMHRFITKMPRRCLHRVNMTPQAQRLRRAGNYKDALSRILEPYYVQAEALLAQGEYDAASEAFGACGEL